MTPFSSALEFYMKEKNIRTYAIAQYCGIDRSNMYKILNGKRNPVSEEVVEQIAEYMRLKPMEREHLLESYRITVMGYTNYYRRSSVQNFLLSQSGGICRRGKWLSGKDCMSVQVDQEELKHAAGIMVGDQQLKRLILGILGLEGQKSSGRISLLMQPDDQTLMDLLTAIGEEADGLRMDHIFCMDDVNHLTLNQQDYNVSCLGAILPLLIQENCDYQPYCYYDSIVSRNNKFNVFSSMVLTSEYAVVFSMEEHYGMMLSGAGTVGRLQEVFDSLKQGASLMAKRIHSLEEQLKILLTMDFESQGIGFSPESCLIPMMPDVFMEKYFDQGMSVSGKLRKAVFQTIRDIEQAFRKSQTTFVFSEQGVQRFLEGGRISELPESAYRPLKYQDRFLMVQELIRECEAGRYQMLRPEVPVSRCSLCLYCGMKAGYLVLPTRQGERVCIEIRESGLLYSFRDYFETLDEKSYYTAEEAAEILKQMFQKQ